MRKTLIAAVALVAAGSASAQLNYSDAVAKQQRCSLIGELWQESYEKGTIMGRTVKQTSQAEMSGELTREQAVALIIIFVSAPKGERFRSGKDAYMTGWAECMDKK